MGGSAGWSRRLPFISTRAKASKCVTLCAKQGAATVRSEDWLGGKRTVGGHICQGLIHKPLALASSD